MASKTSLGIEIGNNKVAIAYLKTSLKGVKLISHAIYPLEKARSRKLRSDKEKLQLVSDLLRAFMEENQISSTDIFLGIPQELTISRDIEFPLAVKEDLRSALRYEMEKYVPMPADQVRFDYQILSEDKRANRLRLLLIVAKKTAIEPYVDFALFFSRPRIRGGIVSLESRSTAFANFFAYAQGKKHARPLPGDLLSLVRADIDACPLKQSGTIPSRDLAPAFGLGLKGLWDTPMQINLLPAELQKKPGKAGHYMMLILIVMVILSGISWGGSHILKQRLLLKQVDVELRRLVSEAKDIGQMETDAQELRERADYLNALGQRHSSALNILRELTNIIPETAWVRDFRLSKKGMQLDGYAESASGLIPLLETSPLFKDVIFLSTITKEKDGKERFRIGLKLTEK